MKVLLLSNAASPHTIKWAKSLATRGISIGIYSLSGCDADIYREHRNITLYVQDFATSFIRQSDGHFKKLAYLKTLPFLHQVIREFEPSIVHAHYASSYGLLGALCRFKPFIISVWGSDVFEFPNISFLHRLILKCNFFRANKILATSHIMAQETNLYTSKPIDVTPFGIDVDFFKPQSIPSMFNKKEIVIGTIKGLEEVYGVEYLIRAFAILKKHYENLPLRLLLVGGGSQEYYLKNLAKELGIDSYTVFTGRIPYDEVVIFHNMMSIFVAVSNRESFGVAVIEASACERPVVVSRTGGLTEVVEDGVTGFIVEPRNPEQTALALEQLIVNEPLRHQMGHAGRERVKRLYNWQDNVEQMISIYRRVLS